MKSQKKIIIVIMIALLTVVGIYTYFIKDWRGGKLNIDKEIVQIIADYLNEHAEDDPAKLIEKLSNLYSGIEEFAIGENIIYPQPEDHFRFDLAENTYNKKHDIYSFKFIYAANKQLPEDNKKFFESVWTLQIVKKQDELKEPPAWAYIFNESQYNDYLNNNFNTFRPIFDGKINKINGNDYTFYLLPKVVVRNEFYILDRATVDVYAILFTKNYIISLCSEFCPAKKLLYQEILDNFASLLTT